MKVSLVRKPTKINPRALEVCKQKLLQRKRASKTKGEAAKSPQRHIKPVLIRE
jgi:hypothetical protein